MTGPSDFAPRLLEWHAQHGRHDLPWQATRDPYRIWLSEIMLQQTRVDTVIPYYARFLSRFPDVASLAAAHTDEVLGLWSGLGYYARARNLHKAAHILVGQHDGRFPPSAAEIATLPGIGRSTAAAITAFAFGERVPILDGNVKRVLCRAFGIEGFPGERKIEDELWKLAADLLPETKVGDYIQAQMDLGATLCTRSRPGCVRCPLAADCVALATDRVSRLPQPRPKKTVPQRQVRVAVIEHDGHVLLERRPPSGIWGGLLALPEIPPEHDVRTWLATRFALLATRTTALATLRHAFTHFRLDIEPMHLCVAERTEAVMEAGHEWLALDDLEGAGLPAPVRRILDAISKGS